MAEIVLLAVLIPAILFINKIKKSRQSLERILAICCCSNRVLAAKIKRKKILELPAAGKHGIHRYSLLLFPYLNLAAVYFVFKDKTWNLRIISYPA